MYCAFRLRCSSPAIFNQSSNFNSDFAGANSVPVRRNSNLLIKLRQPRICLAAQSVHSVQEPEASVSYEYTSSVGSSSLQLSQWNLTQRHVLLLNVIACAVAVSATWLFFSAIPTLLAFKRAAESLEKLMDVTREELPDTMAAIRLSGMEIGDLTMELSDLGQDITQGVRNSTRAVRVAEERLRQLTKFTPVPMQGIVPEEADHEGPALARSVRSIRENIVKGRFFLQMFFALTRFSKLAFNYLAKQAKK